MLSNAAAVTVALGAGRPGAGSICGTWRSAGARRALGVRRGQDGDERGEEGEERDIREVGAGLQLDVDGAQVQYDAALALGSQRARSAGRKRPAVWRTARPHSAHLQRHLLLEALLRAPPPVAPKQGEDVVDLALDAVDAVHAHCEPPLPPPQTGAGTILLSPSSSPSPPH